MTQLTFSEAEYNLKKRKTRREKFLERMEGLIPWGKLEHQLAKKYFKGKTGRKPYPLHVMLRVHVMQLLYNLSDPAWRTRYRDRIHAPLRWTSHGR